MAKAEDKKPKLSDAEKLKSLKKKLKKLKASVKDAAAGLETRASSAAEAAVAAIKAAKPTKLVSPLAPARFPDLPVIEGAEFASGAAGIKYQGRTDVMLVRLAPGHYRVSASYAGLVREQRINLSRGHKTLVLAW